jgi:hypothetical protein
MCERVCVSRAHTRQFTYTAGLAQCTDRRCHPKNELGDGRLTNAARPERAGTVCAQKRANSLSGHVMTGGEQQW